MPTRDWAGERVGILTVMGRGGERHGRAAWICLCDCGREVARAAGELRVIKSCGCRWRAPRHGHAGIGGAQPSPTYRSWVHAKRRCDDPKDDAFPDYGARGISFCDRWRDFANFLADMGERPRGMTLDRIDNDGNYEPGNCRWSTALEQARNRRCNRMVATTSGLALTMSEYAAEAGVGASALGVRVRSGQTAAEAVRAIKSNPLSGRAKLGAFRSDTHRQCITCREIKPRSDFYTKRNPLPSHDPQSSQCIECARTYAREYVRARREAG